MSRGITTSIAASLALMVSHQLWSWGPSRVEQASPEVIKPSFPLNDQQQWYTKESYLLWHPHEDDVDWADRITIENSSGTELSVHLKKPDYGWSSGLRLAFGRYLPHHDHWDASITATYFYSNIENQSSPKSSNNSFLQPLWSPLLPSEGFSRLKGNWRLNFFTFDLGLGRDIFVSSKLIAHPFFNLRSALIYENNAARYSFAGPSQSDSTIHQSNKINFKGFNDYWGIGPRIGSNFIFYLNRSWTLLGSLSGSILLGGSKVDQNVRILQQSIVLNKDQKFHASHHEFAIRGNLEGSLGLGWEKWISQNRVRVAPSIVFEVAQWYDMNQWIALKLPYNINHQGVSIFETDRRHGDLAFWGFNFNLQVDF